MNIVNRQTGVSLITAVLLLLSLTVPDAFAHATPMVYEPAASAILDRIPQRVRIQFSEHIEPKASSITIYAPDGSRVDTNDGIPDGTDPHIFSVGVRDGGEGLYTVSWQVVSQDDGHFTKGGFSFSVGKVGDAAAASASPVEVQHNSTTSQAATVAIELLGQAMLIGVLATIALLWRSLPRTRMFEARQASFERGFAITVVVATVLILIGVGGFLFFKTVDLQQSRAGGFVETLMTFLTTVDGRFALYRAVLGVIFLAMFYISRKQILATDSLSKAEMLLFVPVALILLSRARVSHAAASHFMPNFSILVNAVHLLSKELWVGTLIVLTMVFLPAISKVERSAKTLAHTLTTLSKYISIALSATGVTGAYIVWLHLKSPTYIFTTQWGTRFVVLSAFAAALAAVRLYNQIVVENNVVSDGLEPLRGVRKDIASSWRFTIPAEMCIGIAVLFVTSQLIITPPPYPPATYAMEKKASSQGAIISLSVQPLDQKQFLLTVVDEKTGAPTPVTKAVVTLQNGEKNIGPLVADTEERFNGGFTFPRALLSTPGHWTIDIAASRAQSYDAVASFQLDYPKEVEASRVSADERHFGSFEAVMTTIALASVLFSAIIYRFSANLNSRASAIDARRGLSGDRFRMPRSLAAGFSTALVVSFLVWASYDSLVKTEFQKLCEANNGTWIQSAPMRNGVVTSPDMMLGCTAESGAYHFAAAREYTYFLHQAGTSEQQGHHH